MDSEKWFVPSGDAKLYDVTRENWTARPVRSNYKWHHREIKTVADCKATIRAGAFSWPGGYPLYFVTSDGAAICWKCARKEFSQVARAIKYHFNDGWRIVACNPNWEDTQLDCEHCSKRIDSAYGE